MMSKVHFTSIIDCELCNQVKSLLDAYNVEYSNSIKAVGVPSLSVDGFEVSGEDILPSPLFTRVLFSNCMVRFTYSKTDGTEREALGTLNERYIPSDQRPKSSEVDWMNSQIRYYDLNVNAWRSFRNDNLELMIPD